VCRPPYAAQAPEHAGFRNLKQMEAAYISRVLERNGGSRVKAARELGVHKTTLYRKMKALGISEKK
jgi:transcriptional regulator with PAS, ATPase and Fis domain